MFKFFSAAPSSSDIMDKEYSSKWFVPYLYHLDENIVCTKKNQLVQVVKLGGFSFETADDEDLDVKKNIRNFLFKGMADPSITLHFHVIRKKRDVYADLGNNADIPDGFASYLDQKWIQKQKNNKGFSNDLYITISYKVSKGINFSFLDDLVDKVLKKNRKKAAQNENMLEGFEQVQEATTRVMNSLRQYSPEKLGVIERNGQKYSELAEFFSSILSCGNNSNILLGFNDLNTVISNKRLYFGKKAIEMKMINGSSKFAGIVSLKEYSQKTWAGMMDTFLQMPFEFVISQSFQFINRQIAIAKMQLQQNRMVQSGDKAISQIAGISEALDMAMGGEIAFGTHHMSVMCVADTLKELDNILSMAAVELTNTGGIGVRERVNMEPAFWAQLPCNEDFIVRSSTINTLNLSGFNSFHNYPTGKKTNNYWGDAVTVMDTTSGTPYYFNFHLRDVGHTTIIGPTGSGKTVLMNFLCAQAQKYQCRLFFFDKDRGAEIFIRALGGSYTAIDPGNKCNFNPLRLANNGENRAFLLDWLKQLVSVNGEAITAEDMDLLSSAIEGNYKLDKKDRRLSNIAAFLGMAGPGTLAGRLSMWHSSGSHSKVFDNDEDAINFDTASVFGFEMSELLRDKVSLGPILSYIFHRINISLDGTPSMIVLDEAWALIDNPIFAPKIKDWLKVLRKLNTFVVFATQSVEDASKSNISDTLIQQTATQIFLPNLKATDVYKTSFMLSEREYQLIKMTDPGSRYFLIKQGNDAVVARVDLSGVGDVVDILSGRADTVIVLDEIRKQYGNNPEVWIPKFSEKLKSIRKIK
jgi:type IV secretion system protein VirB4